MSDAKSNLGRIKLRKYFYQEAKALVVNAELIYCIELTFTIDEKSL